MGTTLIASRTDGVTDKDRTVRMLAADPDWSCPTTRAVSRMCRALLSAGVDTDVIYDAAYAGMIP